MGLRSILVLVHSMIGCGLIIYGFYLNLSAFRHPNTFQKIRTKGSLVMFIGNAIMFVTSVYRVFWTFGLGSILMALIFGYFAKLYLRRYLDE